MEAQVSQLDTPLPAEETAQDFSVPDESQTGTQKIREDEVGSPCLDENPTKPMDTGAETAISGDGGGLLNYPSAEELIAKARAPVKREYIRSAPVRSVNAKDEGDNNGTVAKVSVEKKSKRQLKRERKEGIEKMAENKHEWDVVVKGTKQVFYCLVGDCVNMTRSKLSGLNHHRAVKHNLSPIPPRPRGRVRNENVKRATKSPSKVKRQNEKIQYDVDARLCRARKQAYKRFVNEEIIFASVATFDQLNDDSKKKIHEKMNCWDQSLPRRRMDTTKRIDIALQQKERTGPCNDVGEEKLDEHTHILNSGETSNNNEYTPDQQKSSERSVHSFVAEYSSSNLDIQRASSCQPLRRSPRFQGIFSKVFFPEPSQSLQTPKDGQNIEKNVNETNQMLQPSLHSMWQCKNKTYTSPKSPLHTNDGGNATPFFEIHHKPHYFQPVQHSLPLEEKLGEETKKENDYAMVKRTRITPKDLKSRGFKSRKQYIEHICSTSIALTKPTRLATLKPKQCTKFK